MRPPREEGGERDERGRGARPPVSPSLPSNGLPRSAADVEPMGVRLRELAALFLKLGVVGFGGPAAHVALMEDEVVRRRGWLTREAFLDYMGATNLIPGPNSTELAIHIGRVRAGGWGLFVAGACFIVPAALMVAAIAWAYVRYGSLPQIAGVLYGVKPVVIAVVLQALFRLGRTALKTRALVALALAAAAAVAAGVNELLVLFASGALMAAVAAARRGEGGRWAGALVGGPLVAGLAQGGAVAAAPASVGLLAILGVFMKIGAVLFGSGYVLLAFLRADLVERLGWLTEGQLLDAVAVGQVTPGPVFTTATFVGWVVAGAPGAVAATVGIFLPAFAFVAASAVLVPRIRASAVAGAGLDGVNAASLALMGVVTVQLGRAALVDLPTLGLVALSAFLLLRLRVSSAWLILGGAVVGLVVRGAL